MIELGICCMEKCMTMVVFNEIKDWVFVFALRIGIAFAVVKI